MSCPDCVDGWTPPAELVERAARIIEDRLDIDAVYVEWHRESTGSWSGDAAKAVLLEQARWIGEQ